MKYMFVLYLIIPNFLRWDWEWSELKTLEWDILNPDYFTWVSNGNTFDFLLKPFFLGYREKSKIRESLPFLYINLKWRAKFQIYRLHIRDSDWLDFMHFSGYKYKIRLVSRSIKREDQALISISTILKFSAHGFINCKASDFSWINVFRRPFFLFLYKNEYILLLFFLTSRDCGWNFKWVSI